ncbi:hypothetical protein CDD83_3131 [Cordyceps sp. RAO-2017]|nr:hypothetical protein CDD83_3131 [Cordyceps sp. RAO-2017]
MHSIHALVLAVAALATAGAAQKNCYQIANYGSGIHGCAQCRSGFRYTSDKFCDIGFECCVGLCCERDD